MDLHEVRSFCFYLPAVVDYVTTAGTRDDNPVASDFCRVIEDRLESWEPPLEMNSPQIRQVLPEIFRFAD